MSIDLPEALAQHLAGDANVTDLLATYDFGPGHANDPAIFTTEDGVPDDAGRTCLYLTQVGGRGWGCRAKRGAECMVDISVFGDKGSAKDVLAAAWAVWERVNRCDLCPYLTGWSEWGVYAEPPIKISAESDFPGYVVRVLCRVLED